MLSELSKARRIIEIRVAGNPRFIAAEDAARYRDALGTVLPMGLPAALLEPCQSPLQDLISRYIRTHGPFEPAELAKHFGLGIDVLRKALNELSATGRVLEGDLHRAVRAANGLITMCSNKSSDARWQGGVNKLKR